MAANEIDQFKTEQINIKRIFQKAFRYWYLFVLAISLFLSGAYLYLRYTTPLYMISSNILLHGGSVNADTYEMDPFMGKRENNKNQINVGEETGVLKAKSLMERVLTELSIHASYFVEGEVKSTEIYGSQNPIRVIVSSLDSAAHNNSINIHILNHKEFLIGDGEESTAQMPYKFGQEIRKPYGTYTVVFSSTQEEKHQNIQVVFHNMAKLAQSYSSNLSVAPTYKDANLLTISLMDPLPQKGIDIVNKLVEVYNKEATENKNLKANNTIQFVEERLKYLTLELSGVEKNIENYKSQNLVTDIASNARQYSDLAVDYNKQLADLGIQINRLESIESYLKNQGVQDDQILSSLGVQDNTLISLISKFNELQLERQRLLQTMKPDNPILQDLNEQKNNLKSNIAENLSTIKQSLVKTRENLLASTGQFESKIKKVPSLEREMLEINRQQGTKESLYAYLLQKKEESSLALAASVSNSRIIDAASASSDPVSPKRQLIYLLAVLAGILLPVGGVYLLESLNEKVKELSEVQQYTSTPVLGQLCQHTSSEPLVVARDEASPIAELFRLIRVNLRFMMRGKENKVILVTSSVSGEGKTFFSINLSMSLALTGKKVVIVDMDLRKPEIMGLLNLADEEGVVDYLEEESLTTLDGVLRPSGILPNLQVIGVGSVPKYPAELLMSSKVQELLEQLKQRFDYVILDSSPVGMVADAFSLAPYIDATIYLARYNHTTRDHFNIIKDINEGQKLKNLMLVMNGAKKSTTYGYGYGYGYGKGQKTSPAAKPKREEGKQVHVVSRQI